MKKSIILPILFYGLFVASPSFSATVTCEIEEVGADTIVLKNCDQRAKGFEKGKKVKVRLQKKGKN